MSADKRKQLLSNTGIRVLTVDSQLEEMIQRTLTEQGFSTSTQPIDPEVLIVENNELLYNQLKDEKRKAFITIGDESYFPENTLFGNVGAEKKPLSFLGGLTQILALQFVQTSTLKNGEELALQVEHSLMHIQEYLALKQYLGDELDEALDHVAVEPGFRHQIDRLTAAVKRVMQNQKDLQLALAPILAAYHSLTSQIEDPFYKEKTRMMVGFYEVSKLSRSMEDPEFQKQAGNPQALFQWLRLLDEWPETKSELAQFRNLTKFPPQIKGQKRRRFKFARKDDDGDSCLSKETQNTEMLKAMLKRGDGHKSISVQNILTEYSTRNHEAISLHWYEGKPIIIASMRTQEELMKARRTRGEDEGKAVRKAQSQLVKTAEDMGALTGLALAGIRDAIPPSLERSNGSYEDNLRFIEHRIRMKFIGGGEVTDYNDGFRGGIAELSEKNLEYYLRVLPDLLEPVSRLVARQPPGIRLDRNQRHVIASLKKDGLWNKGTHIDLERFEDTPTMNDVAASAITCPGMYTGTIPSSRYPRLQWHTGELPKAMTPAQAALASFYTSAKRIYSTISKNCTYAEENLKTWFTDLNEAEAQLYATGIWRGLLAFSSAMHHYKVQEDPALHTTSDPALFKELQKINIFEMAMGLWGAIKFSNRLAGKQENNEDKRTLCSLSNELNIIYGMFYREFHNKYEARRYIPK